MPGKMCLVGFSMLHGEDFLPSAAKGLITITWFNINILRKYELELTYFKQYLIIKWFIKKAVESFFKYLLKINKNFKNKTLWTKVGSNLNLNPDWKKLIEQKKKKN